MAPQVKIDTEAVRALAELLRETDLTEIEYQENSTRIKVLRTVQQVAVPVADMSALAPAVKQNAATAVDIETSSSDQPKDDWAGHPGTIEAQMVGTVYLAPGPGADPFVSVGSKVEEGQTLFIIEAMKVMNMIKAPKSGIVKHIFVKDAQPVEYGDPIIVVG